MRRVIGVHGINNFDRHREPSAAAAELARIWGAALASAPGLSPDVAAGFTMAYYAHRLRPETGQGMDDPYAMDPELQRMLSNWALAVPLALEVDQGRLTLPVRQAVERIARYSGLQKAVLEPFVAVMLREVRTYFRNRRARQAARDQVTDAIDRSGATIVLAHSLGSVVTYETLLAEPDLHVDSLITLGSPLGLPGVVFDRLEPSGAHLKPLPNVARWVNVADRGDIVAVPRHLKDTFVGIHRDVEVTIGAVACHDVELYLKNAVVGAEVATALST
jgi:hypothetical protein